MTRIISEKYRNGKGAVDLLKFEPPILYTEFAKYYDRLESQYRDYGLEASWINRILDERDAGSIIDLSCGTASHVSGLVPEVSSRQLVAADASKEMIEVARAKLSGKDVSILQSDFLSIPFRKNIFDAAICMYWSIAGLDENLVRNLFYETNAILKNKGVFIFDTENVEGIKEELLNVPYIDAFFPDNEEVCDTGEL